MTGGQALVASLLAQGIDTIFALPGVQLDGAFDALHDAVAAGKIRVVHPRHEQTAAYMADGYARVTGRLGTCAVVPGPGLLNATAALATAYACNSPVLCVTGQIQSDLIGVGRGQLHEIPNQLEMVRSVTKFSGRATQPAAVPGLVNEALTNLWSGRIRPVEIEVPPDTLFANDDVTLLPGVERPTRFAGDRERIEQAAKLLGNASNPVIFAGGGVIGADASPELRELSDLLQAPVMMTQNGKGAISARSPFALNTLSVREEIAKADVILVVGTRFLEASTQPWGPKGDRKVIQLDIDPEELGRNSAISLGIEADAKAGWRVDGASWFAQHLADEPRAGTWRIAAGNDGEDLGGSAPGRIRPSDSSRTPRRCIYIGEMTQIAYFSSVGFPVYEPRTYFTPAIRGLWDGDSRPLLARRWVHRIELWYRSTAMAGLASRSMNLPPRPNMESPQSRWCSTTRRMATCDGSRRWSSMAAPSPPTYAIRLWQARRCIGVAGRRATTPDELRIPVGEAIKANEPTLIEIPVQAMPDPWKMLKIR
jgi:acetolactate synthase-1/2/3 large subunit